MRFLTAFFLTCAVLWPQSSQAAGEKPVLEYSISGLKGSLLNNARAWLGELPVSPQGRLNFTVTAVQRVEDSLKALGYYNADVSIVLQRTEPVWSLQINVIPNEPVLISAINIEVLGAARDDPAFEELLANVPFRVGDVLSHGDYERFKNRLLALGQQRGYFDAQLTERRVAVNVATDSAVIDLHYASGERFRFGEVTYNGSTLEPKLLEELQPFKAGDYFDHTRLQALQADLQRTRYFSGVLVRPEFDKVENHRVPLLVTLTPARRHSFDVGVGYSTDTQERVSMVWRTPLLNRYGHSQETRVSWSAVNPSGRFTYSIPLSHPLNDVLHLSALVEDNEYGDTQSRQKEASILREMRLTRWVQSYSARVLEESWQLKNTKFNNLYTLPGIAFSRSDRKGSLVNPDSGFSQFYKIEAGSEQLGSDINLARATANFSYIMSPAEAQRIVVRAAVGAVFIANSDRSKLAPSLTFFAGGAQSVRGYGYQSIGNDIRVTRNDGRTQKLVVGGERLVTGTLEYQYYFTPTWRGALFVDAGDAFDSADMDLKYGPGFGVHYISPVGAVRLDLANGVSENGGDWRIHVTIGAEF
jgi:translocation and assembly module TamA